MAFTAPHFSAFLTLLLTLVLPSPNHSLLIHHPSTSQGQTQRPTGLDHILYPPRALNSTHLTPSPLHPFHTLHDFPCHHIPRQHLTLPNNTSVYTRLATNSQVSTMLQLASHPPFSTPSIPIIVLFHGGQSCEWSRQIIPIWAQVAQRMMPICMVAVDGRRYSLVNYNLIVLGFPTILRVQNNRKAEVYRAPRNVKRLTQWVVKVTGVAPEQWQHIDDTPLAHVEWTEDGEERDWVLVGANLVCGINVIGALVRLAHWIRRRWPKEG